ncbi:MAG: methyltransferase domain-containing protein [Parvularculaceae bacterium]
MSQERSYYLGTHDVEAWRLGVQHRVWRARTLDVWRRAGITDGSTVIDAGSGPGHASLDLAEIVGPRGKVYALDRSDNFRTAIEAGAKARGLDNVALHNVDLMLDRVPVSGVDAVFIRWVFIFIADPVQVLKKLAGALRPGGKFICHDYFDWGTMAWTPHQPVLAEFVETAVRDWHASAGNIDVARTLLPALPEAGLKLIEANPIVFTTTPKDFTWQWPKTFVPPHARRLAERGVVTTEWAEKVAKAWDAAETDPRTVMTTPLLMEIVAERV